MSNIEYVKADDNGASTLVDYSMTNPVYTRTRTRVLVYTHTYDLKALARECYCCLVYVDVTLLPR